MDASFLRAPLAARVDGLLDAGAGRRILCDAGGAAAIAVEGLLRGRRVVVAGTDPQRVSGAIGAAESAVLCAAFDEARGRARRDGVACILLLDSGGAKLTEGVAALGAFRRLETAALDAVAAGVPVAAVIGRNCFGGASLLAFAAGRRFYFPGSRLGLSGPRALDGPAAMLAPDEIERLYGPQARLGLDAGGRMLPDTPHAVREALSEWLAHARARADATTACRDATERRITAADPAKVPGERAVSPRLGEMLDSMLPAGWSVATSGGVFWGVARDREGALVVAGFEPGVPVGAAACLRLAAIARELACEDERARTVLLLDSPGHAADRREEALLPSAAVARLAAAWRALHVSGWGVELWVRGEAGGAIYVALAAAASRVFAVRDARFQTLTARAVADVLGTAAPADAPAVTAIAAGVIDDWLPDSRTEVVLP